MCSVVRVLSISYLFMLAPHPQHSTCPVWLLCQGLFWIMRLLGFYHMCSLTGCFLLLLWSVLLCGDLQLIVRVEGPLYPGRSVFGESQPEPWGRECGYCQLGSNEPLSLLCAFSCCYAQLPRTSNIRRKGMLWITVWGYESSSPGRHGGLGAAAVWQEQKAAGSQVGGQINVNYMWAWPSQWLISSSPSPNRAPRRTKTKKAPEPVEGSASL